jgi:prepilin-type N-terminal cleavage/methylation domain-containing protein
MKRNIFRLFPGMPRLNKDQRGFTLLEIIIAIALLGIFSLSIVTGLGTSSKTLFMTDEKETAKNLAESQMEYVKGLPFNSSYIPQAIPAEYDGYSVDSPILTDTLVSDGNLQKIIIIVRHGDREILLTPDATLEGFKVR